MTGKVGWIESGLYVPRGTYEAVQEAAQSAFGGLETAARRVEVLDEEYHLVYIVARFAPSFGRS
eukprot:SAG11_NODE_33405_length_277_cov_1.157303_1_plen_63_part_01